MSDHDESIIKTLVGLATDLNSVGWDLPARLYHLVEDVNDPTARLVGVLPTHPIDDLQSGFDAGSRVPANVHGLVIVHEAVRHLTYDELMKVEPSMFDEIKKEAKIGDVFDDKKIEQLLRSYYQETILAKLPSPNALPPERRVEVRVAAAIMRDGSLMKLSMTRGNDLECGATVGKVSSNEALASCLYQFLHNLRPAPEASDPLTVVSDYQTLEVLSALPTHQGLT